MYCHSRDALVRCVRWLTLAMLYTLAACAQLRAASGDEGGAGPKNIIVLFADGAASTQWEFGRVSSRYLRRQPFYSTDVVMRDGALGLMSTLPENALVTDSAAAASAMSTGYKTNNDMLSVLPDGKPVQTLMEAARAAGKRIGLVTTATVYDASPAAFTVHEKSRRAAQAIVDRYAAFGPDVLMGGGRDYFVPKAQAGGKRTDGKDVIAAFRAKGYEYVSNVAGLGAARGPRVLGLFADEDMDYEIDRDIAREPSTAQMTAAALRFLSQEAPEGFVLFVENENVDTAGHRNDVAALMRDLWAFDDAVKIALDFQRQRPGDTLVIVTGDHETGGLSLTNATQSLDPKSRRFYASNRHLDMVSRIAGSLDQAAQALGSKPDAAALDRIVAQYFPGFELDQDLREAILEQRLLERNFGFITQSALSRMVSRQTAIYWGTTGHTSEPAVVGALGPGAARFRGYMDNTEFGVRLRALMSAVSPQREKAAASR